MAILKDSGARRQFETGAVRDMQEGKGRCDLLPLDTVEKLLDLGNELGKIEQFKNTGDPCFLVAALTEFMIDCFLGVESALLEVSKHFEDGAVKYGDNNWKKGIPVRCYIDSAVRHYLKWAKDETDEPHDRAFLWNLLCAVWTCENLPELNEYKTERNMV